MIQEIFLTEGKTLAELLEQYFWEFVFEDDL